MKVEVRCPNEGCATYGTLQLLSCARISMTGLLALDEDFGPIECPFCGSIVGVSRLSNDSAQFPLGKTHMTDAVVIALAGGEDEARLSAAKIAAEFVACHVASDPGSLPATFGDVAQLTAGDIVTQHIYSGNVIWVVTKPDRQHTYVMLAREYPFV